MAYSVAFVIMLYVNCYPIREQGMVGEFCIEFRSILVGMQITQHFSQLAAGQQTWKRLKYAWNRIQWRKMEVSLVYLWASHHGTDEHLRRNPLNFWMT